MSLKLPSWTQPIVFGGLLSGLMSLMVSGVATYKAIGLPNDFVTTWMSAWLPSWAVAFPAVLIVAPIVRRLTAFVVRPAGQN